MSGSRYLPEIRSHFPGERADDLLAMIDLLAEARARAGGRPPLDRWYEFAARVLGIASHLFRAAELQEESRQLRVRFAGIASSPPLQEAFIRSFSERLLRADSALEAIEDGLDSLFTLPSHGLDGPVKNSSY
jgi:hypothetical protein